MIEITPPPRRRAPVPAIVAQNEALRDRTILTFDLSLTSTGYAINTPRSVTTGLIQSKHKGIARLTDLRNQLAALAEEVHPTHWGVEGYSFGSKARHHAIGEWGGLAKWTLENLFPGRGYILSPSTVKKFMTGNHQAQKTEMVLNLRNRYSLNIHQEDEADAASIGIALDAYLNGPEAAGNLTQFQKDALGWLPQKGKKKTIPVELVG